MVDCFVFGVHQHDVIMHIQYMHDSRGQSTTFSKVNRLHFKGYELINVCRDRGSTVYGIFKQPGSIENMQYLY